MSHNYNQKKKTPKSIHKISRVTHYSITKSSLKRDGVTPAYRHFRNFALSEPFIPKQRLET